MTIPDSVFHELDLPDADEMVIKSDLLIAIRDRVKKSGLNQTQAAISLGMPRTEVSHLMRGRITRFTIDRLVRALNNLDGSVRVRVVLEPHDDGPGRAVPPGTPKRGPGDERG